MEEEEEEEKEDEEVEEGELRRTEGGAGSILDPETVCLLLPTKTIKRLAFFSRAISFSIDMSGMETA